MAAVSVNEFIFTKPRKSQPRTGHTREPNSTHLKLKRKTCARPHVKSQHTNAHQTNCGAAESFAKFFSKLGGVYDFPFREISREIRVVIWLFLPRNSSLGWEELGKSTVRDRNGQSPEKK